MISQVINLSNNNTYKLYKEKYNLLSSQNKGLFGIEIRDVPTEIINSNWKNQSLKIFSINNELLFLGSLEEIIENKSALNIPEQIIFEVNRIIEKYESNDMLSYEIGGKNFDFKYAHVMGILNVTPDSFSDGGQHFNFNEAVDYAIEMLELGSDIIDVGGESTRPGSDSVSESEELKRVIPVIKEILTRSPNAIISVDTTKSKVAKEALDCGASIVNDISGGTFDPDIFKIVKDFDASMVIMHIKDKPKSMQVSPQYSYVVSEVYNYLATQSKIASDFGIKKIIVDPGIGFGKRVEDNLSLIERLEDFKSLGFPILIGLSRKSFIGNILNLPVEERDDVTNSLNSLALSNGARIIRTHNVKHAVQTCKMYNRLINH